MSTTTRYFGRLSLDRKECEIIKKEWCQMYSFVECRLTIFFSPSVFSCVDCLSEVEP